MANSRQPSFMYRNELFYLVSYNY